jgi:hypothetical protein
MLMNDPPATRYNTGEPYYDSLAMRLTFIILNPNNPIFSINFPKELPTIRARATGSPLNANESPTLQYPGNGDVILDGASSLPGNITVRVDKFHSWVMGSSSR